MAAKGIEPLDTLGVGVQVYYPKQPSMPLQGIEPCYAESLMQGKSVPLTVSGEHSKSHGTAYPVYADHPSP